MFFNRKECNLNVYKKSISNHMAPQIIYLAIFLIALLLNANQHGKVKTGKHNFWTSLISTIIGLSLLYWGGFFDNLFN